MKGHVLQSVGLAVLLALAGAGTAAAQLDPFTVVAVQPAATLLLPYFQVDLDDPDGVTTFFSINNASASAAVAHVVIWSDLAVPVLSFDIYLTGFDVQQINLREVLVNGRLPRTADAGTDTADTSSPLDGISNKGNFSQDINFPGSDGPCAVVYPPNLEIFQPGTLAHLRAALTGNPSALLGGNCCGRNFGDGHARGYVTVDTVTQCTLQGPGDPGYFSSGVADNRNILWGDYFYVTESRLPVAHGEPLVHIVSDLGNPEAAPGQYTFYTRYAAISGQDSRQPLATNFAAPYGRQSLAKLRRDTALVVWRDPKVAQSPFTCGTNPSWFPLGQEMIIAFDEQEGATVLTGTPFPGATQAVVVGSPALPVPADAGWLYLNLNTTGGAAIPAEDPTAAQAWVVVLHDFAGRHSRAAGTVALDSATAPNHIDPIVP